MKKTVNFKSYIKKPKKRRPGVHSKNKYSKCKNSKLYKKLDKGQNS